jgi:hypothetical protein
VRVRVCVCVCVSVCMCVCVCVCECECVDRYPSTYRGNSLATEAGRGNGTVGQSQLALRTRRAVNSSNLVGPDRMPGLRSNVFKAAHTYLWRAFQSSFWQPDEQYQNNLQPPQRSLPAPLHFSHSEAMMGRLANNRGVVQDGDGYVCNHDGTGRQLFYIFFFNL